VESLRVSGHGPPDRASQSQAVNIPHSSPQHQLLRITATMSGKIISVTSSSHFEKLLSASTYTVVDFYADWCGPCKAIAPVFQGLAEKETKAGKLQFCKVDVDAQQEIAKKYGVSA
jgi:thioredoxin-like negative regulator of GroEL